MAKSNTPSAPSIAHAPLTYIGFFSSKDICPSAATLPLAHIFPSEAVTLQLNCCVPLFFTSYQIQVLHQNGHYKRRCEIHHFQLVHLHNSQGISMLYPYLFSLCWILTNSVNLPLLFLKD